MGSGRIGKGDSRRRRGRKYSPRTRHTCLFCSKVYHSYWALMIHTNWHTGETPYQCQECEESFRDPRLLRQHKLVVHLKIKFQCDHCRKCFWNNNNLRRHVRSGCPRLHVAKATRKGNADSKAKGDLKITFQCDQCHRCFASKSNLGRHVQNSCPGRITAVETGTEDSKGQGSSSKTTEGQSQERNDKVSRDGKPYFECHICQKTYSYRSSLTRHWQNTHLDIDHLKSPEEFRCPDCEAIFRTNRLLVEHRREEHGLQAFECPVCLARFSTYSSLIRHHKKFHGGDSEETNSVEESAASSSSSSASNNGHQDDFPPPPSVPVLTSSPSSTTPEESPMELLTRWRNDLWRNSDGNSSYFLHLGRYDPSSS